MRSPLRIKLVEVIINYSLLSPLLLILGVHYLLMRSRLTDSSCYICVYLSISLGSLDIEALLLGVFLVARPLPLGQPSLGVGLRSRILRVKVLGITDLVLSLFRNEDLSSTLCLLHHVVSLLVLFLLRHSFFNQLLEVFIVIH